MNCKFCNGPLNGTETVCPICGKQLNSNTQQPVTAQQQMVQQPVTAQQQMVQQPVTPQQQMVQQPVTPQQQMVQQPVTAQQQMVQQPVTAQQQMVQQPVTPQQQMVQQPEVKEGMCRKCGKRLPSNGFCMYCGENNNISKEELEVKSKSNNDELILLKSYIGNNAETIISGGFSFSAFLFGQAYFIYRKAWGPLLASFLITLVSDMLFSIIKIPFSNLLVIIGLAIYYGLKFNDIYTDDARKNIKKILQMNPNVPIGELSEKYKDKGHLPKFIIFILTALFLASIIFIIIVSFSSTKNAMNKARAYSFGNVASHYINGFRNAVSADEVKCSNGTIEEKISQYPYDTVFYFPIDTKTEETNNLMESGGKSPYQNKEIRGYIVGYKELADEELHTVRTTYSIVLLDEENNGINDLTSEKNLSQYDYNNRNTTKLTYDKLISNGEIIKPTKYYNSEGEATPLGTKKIAKCSLIG